MIRLNKNIDQQTISKLNLRLSDKPLNAQNKRAARIFEYPHLDNVFIMECDIYGNPMPENSCFLAFYGNHGLIGKYLTIDMLKNASEEDIRNMVENNSNG